MAAPDPNAPFTPTPPTAQQIADAQKMAYDDAFACDNASLEADKKTIRDFKRIVEGNPMLTPQQVLDGFEAREPGSALRIYFRIAYIIKALTDPFTGVLDKAYWPTREYLPAMDGTLTATQVPWSLTDNTGMTVYPDQATAVSHSHTMLADWITANTTTVSDGHGGTVSKVKPNPAAFSGAL